MGFYYFFDMLYFGAKTLERTNENVQHLNSEEIIQYIANAKKKTPVKVYIKGDLSNIPFPSEVKTFLSDGSGVLFGDWSQIEPVLTNYKNEIADYVIENDRRNSGVPLQDLKELEARIEPGAIVREHVKIEKQAIIMMGAVVNIGAIIGEGTMIDMNAVVGGRGQIGKSCHIGAGAVIAGVIEPPSADPVVIEDNVLVGANAVILEGVRVGKGSVVAAGSVVTENVPPNVVVAGTPARIIKEIDEKTKSKTEIIEELRKL